MTGSGKTGFAGRDFPSVNALAMPLIDKLLEDAGQLRISVEKIENGCTVVDAGINCTGGFEAGRRIAEICMGNLGTVQVRPGLADELAQIYIDVNTSQPVISCLGSQYAGWLLDYRKDEKFQGLGSGPARALAVKEELFGHLHYRDKHHRSCLVLETSVFPPTGLLEYIAGECDISPYDLTVILTPTGCPAGVVQIGARVVEVAMHKAHALNFPLHSVVEGVGTVPLSLPVKDSMTAMGRTNDAILFGGVVSLVVDCDDDDAENLANQLPSSNSRDYGTPFAQIFKEYDFDFGRIDPMLFSPAKVSVSVLSSGRTFTAGQIDGKMLAKSGFGPHWIPAQ